jgi:hypothetical protein
LRPIRVKLAISKKRQGRRTRGKAHGLSLKILFFDPFYANGQKSVGFGAAIARYTVIKSCDSLPLSHSLQKSLVL